MKPLDFLQQRLHQPVLVELRGRSALRGILEEVDQHLNLVLSAAQEVGPEGAAAAPAAGLTFLRGDAVIFISP